MADQKIKLDNSKSRFTRKNEEEKKNQADFNNSVSEYQVQQTEIIKKSADLTSKFMDIIKDTTLNENKGPIQKQIEQQICRDLTDLSLELNQDQTQPEGIGSAGMTLLLLKIVLLQKDKINELGYKISKLEKVSSVVENE